MFRLLILFVSYALGVYSFESLPYRQSHGILLDFSSIERQRILKPQLSLMDYDKLLKIKSKCHTSDFSVAYSLLIKNAQNALNEGNFSVVNKTQTPPSGDKRDYLSYGPYWWPDPDRPDGLPWIRQDGQVNPLTRDGKTDFETKKKMFNNTFHLALAYFFSDNEKYANKAFELIHIWFIDKDSRMNPNLQFAQGIPGINEGRGIGIIEFADIGNIISSIEILEIKGVIDTTAITDLRNWFTDYLKWLQTSENGIFEKNTKNNHAVWYDVQVVSILMFLDRIEEAKKVLEDVKTKRIATQIMPDGRQPHELNRTKALSYSTMNLRGFTNLAYFGKRLGVDLWNYIPENGGGIKKAYEFLMPYANGSEKWEYQQIGSLNKALETLRKLFVQAGSQFNNDLYCSIGKLSKKENTSLIYNCF